MRVGGGRVVGGVDRVALGRGRQVDGRLRERGVALGHADEMRSVLRRDRDGQRLRIGVADVFRCEADRAAGRCRADLRRLRASARPSRPRRRDRCCASTCAAPRSGCSALRRPCRRAARGAGSTARAAACSSCRTHVSGSIGAEAAANSSRFSAARASPLANRAIAASASSDDARSPSRRGRARCRRARDAGSARRRRSSAAAGRTPSSATAAPR